MGEKTIMEMADSIMSTMGMSESVPLSEKPPSTERLVGKSYNSDLPEMSDTQRDSLISEVVKAESKEKEETGNGECGEITFKSPPKKRRLAKKFSFEVTPVKKEDDLSEMTSVGAIGIGPQGNTPAADPDNPHKKKKKKRNRKTLASFINTAFIK
jgi:hypothetical protein